MSTIKVPVTIVYGGGSSPAMNIFHGRTDANAGAVTLDGEVQEMIDALQDFYEGIKTAYGAGTTITIGEGTIVDPYGSPTYANITPRIVQGTRPGGVEPALLAVTVTWRTTAATKSGRGRTFLGPFGVDVAQSDGTVNDTELEKMRTAAMDLVAASSGVNLWALGVYSTKDGVLRDFTTSNVRDVFSTMRSRR